MTHTVASSFRQLQSDGVSVTASRPRARLPLLQSPSSLTNAPRCGRRPGSGGRRGSPPCRSNSDARVCRECGGAPGGRPLVARGEQEREKEGDGETRAAFISLASSHPPPTLHPHTLQPVSYVSLALTVLTGAGIVTYYDHLKKTKLRSMGAPGATAGAAAVGGPFSLVDSRGAPFTEANLKGRWSLLYFGFTLCPDICPDELDKVATVVDDLKKNHSIDATPVFISVDPARDTPARVGAYVAEFHPAMVGLTGDENAVKAAAKAFRVYHAKAGVDPTRPDDYLIDHSIITYLLNPDAKFVTFYGRNVEAGAVAASIVERVREWEAAQRVG